MATSNVDSKSSGEISTTASISASSIPSNIANISADSVDHITPLNGRTIYKSALDLSPNIRSRHLEDNDQNGSTHDHNGDQFSERQNVESESHGGTSTSPNQTSMIRSRGNDDLRSLLGEFTSKIEETQQKIASDLKNELKEVKDNFSEVLAPIKTSIVEANKKIDALEENHKLKIDANTCKIVDTANKLQNAELKIRQLQQQIAATPATSNQSSSFNPAILGRLNNIVVSGIEETQGEDLIAKLKDISSKLNCELSQFKARRLGKAKSQQNNANTPTKPRAILVELSSNWEKRKLYAARTKLKNTTDYSQVFFNEDLDKNSSELFYKARQAKKLHKIKSIWTYGCQVFFTNLGSEQPILLTSPSQLPSSNMENVPANTIDSRSQITTPSQGSLRASPQATSEEAAPPGTPGAQNEAL